MAYRTDDRIYETSVTTGTGEYTLDGAQVGFQSFVAGIGNTNTCPYFATDGTNWEVGIGTVVTGPNRLQRTIIISSSNADAAVNWGAGTRKLRCGMPAANSPRGATESRTSNTILAQSDFGKSIVITSGTFSQTLTAAATLGDGWFCHYYNRGLGLITLDPNGAETINGAATLAIPNGHGGLIFCDGAAFFMVSAPGNEAVGTFTPTVTLVGGAGNTVPVYSTNTGRFSRYGNRALIDVLLTGDGGAEGAGTGVVTIGLPITSSASEPAGTFPCGFGSNGATNFILFGSIGAGAGVITLSYASSISAIGSLLGNDQSNTSRSIRLRFFYEV